MPVDKNDYTKQAKFDRLENALQVYKNAGDVTGIAAAQEVLYNAEMAPDDDSVRQVELEFNSGNYSPSGGDDMPQTHVDSPDDATNPPGQPFGSSTPVNSSQPNAPSEPITPFDPIEPPDEPEHDQPEHDGGGDYD